HPEVHHTEHGSKYLENFLFSICKCTRDWSLGNWIDQACEEIREQSAGRRVICAVSGGVDSTLMATRPDRAIGKKSHPVRVDNDPLRETEVEEVSTTLRNVLGLNLEVLRAGGRFLGKQKGVTDPERKRQLIGREFINVFFPNVGSEDLL